MRNHTKLRAFEPALPAGRLADEMAVLIYKVTKGFPKDEIYGLTSQMRRSVVSAPSNIVEGCARESQANIIGSLKLLLDHYGNCIINIHWLADWVILESQKLGSMN